MPITLSWIGAVIEEEFDNLYVTILDSVNQRRLPVCIFRIDFAPLLQEEFDDFDVPREHSEM